MKKTLLVAPTVLVIAAAMTACDKTNTNNKTASNLPKDAVRQADGTYRYADGSVHNSDGSLVNEAPRRETRDNADRMDNQKANNPDATNQGNNQADLDVTQAIRKAVLGREGMSMSAKNITIVTDKSTVTLKGEVPTESEKATIAEIAMNNSGGRTVDNRLDVKPPAPPSPPK